jgi:hypothetical protein
LKKIIHISCPASSIEDLLNSNLASIRLRCGLIFNQFKTKNYLFDYSFDLLKKNRIDIFLVTKLSEYNLQNIFNEVLIAKSNNTKIVVDYTDHILSNLTSKRSVVYQKIFSVADEAIVSSKLLKDYLSNFFKKKITVIEDCIEVPILKFSIKEKLTKSILWFGHLSNLKYLIKFLLNFKYSEKINFFILVNQPHVAKNSFINNTFPSNFNIMIDEWSLDRQIEYSQICDICIIPSDVNDERKNGVSSNRLLTALSMGLPTAANKIDSYLDFKDFFTNIENFNNLLHLIENTNDYASIVDEAQKNILSQFKPEYLSNKWKLLFDSL